MLVPVSLSNMYLPDIAIRGVVRAHFSKECSYAFFDKVLNQSLEDVAPLHLAVVLEPDTCGTSVSVWSPTPFSDAIGLSAIRDDGKVFKSMVNVHVAHPAVADDDCKHVVENMMHDITPTIFRFIKGWRKDAMVYATSISKKNDKAQKKAAKSLRRLENALCIGIESGFKRCLAQMTGIEVGASPDRNARGTLTSAVMRKLSRSEFGVFDAHRAADNSFIIHTVRGGCAHHIEFISEYGNASGEPVPTATDGATSVVVMNPNHQSVRGGRTLRDARTWNGSCIPGYFVLGVPFDAVAMMLPQLIDVIAGVADIGDVDAMTATAFAPSIEFNARNKTWRMGSKSAEAEAYRKKRAEALQRIDSMWPCKRRMSEGE